MSSQERLAQWKLRYYFAIPLNIKQDKLALPPSDLFQFHSSAMKLFEVFFRGSYFFAPEIGRLLPSKVAGRQMQQHWTAS